MCWTPRYAHSAVRHVMLEPPVAVALEDDGNDDEQPMYPVAHGWPLFGLCVATLARAALHHARAPPTVMAGQPLKRAPPLLPAAAFIEMLRSAHFAHEADREHAGRAYSAVLARILDAADALKCQGARAAPRER